MSQRCRRGLRHFLPRIACLLLIASLTFGICQPGADAQTALYPSGDANHQGTVAPVVIETLNGANQAVPATATTPLPVQVSGTNQTSDRQAGPTALTAVNNAVTVNSQGTATVGVTVASNTNVTLVAEVTTDPAGLINWQTTNLIPQACGTNVTSIASGTNGTWYMSTGGFATARIRVTAVGGTPTATVSLDAGAGDNNVCITQAIQAATITLGQTTKSGSVPVTIASDQFAADPCSSAAGIAKASVPINITSGTTTGLVAVSGTTTIYVCGFSLTISEVVTTANTFQLESGTGAACVTTQNALTGLYGAGGVTAAAPLVISVGNAGVTVVKTPASGVLCAVTAIGASGSFQGELTYVQQ